MRAKFMDNNDQDNAENRNGQEEYEEWIRHPVSADDYGVSGMHSAKHRHHVLAHRHIFAKSNDAEEVHQVVTDRGIILCVDVAEKVDDVVICAARYMHIAEEDNNIAIDSALHIDTAEEADCVVNGCADGHVNVAA